MTMDRKEMIQYLGKTGEAIVRNHLTSKGVRIIDSIDQFDSTKDFIVLDKDDRKYRIEVKTEQPYVLKDWFSFATNQLKKCVNADVVYFVSVPPLIRKDYEYGGKLFCVLPKQDPFQYHRYQMKSGKRMIGIPIKQDPVKYIRDLTKEELKVLTRYLFTDY